MLHANVGWLHEKEAQRGWLIAEAFGRNEGNPFFQVGFRYWLVPDRHK